MPAADLSEIDLNNLEKEWVEHVNKVRTFTDRSAETKKAEAECKADLELVEATLLRDIRNTPDKFHLSPKPTEGAIKNCVLYQKRYKEAERRYIQAKYENDLVDGVLRTLDHRKRALENLVTLWQQGYFAAPREKKANGVPRSAMKTNTKVPTLDDQDIPF